MKRVMAVAFGACALVAIGSAIYADGSHTGFETRPIRLGTSGGNISDISTFFCCGGTLGSLVTTGSTQYILSNNHVLANSNNGVVGQDIIQPGLIDQSPVCTQDANDRVADLSTWIPIDRRRTANNRADAAIAQVVAGAVQTNGNVRDIGCISGRATGTVGMGVSKSGRTTGFTTGSISSVNVSILVAYPNQPCTNGGKAARFINTFRVISSTFSAGGDSGSLIVRSSDNAAVGLLFAGGSTDTFANQINDVRTEFVNRGWNIDMVVGTGCAGFTGSDASEEADFDPAFIDAQAGQMMLEQYLRGYYSEIRSLLGTGIGLGNPYVIEVYVDQTNPRFTDVLNYLPGEINGVDVVLVPIDPPRAF